MSAGSGTTLIKLEPTREADLQVALAIEQINNCTLRNQLHHQHMIIAQLNEYIKRLNRRSNN